MKKILVFILGLLVYVISYGQIYTSVKYLDKFDDVVKEQTVKTIVEKTDSTFVIETKGKEPLEYRIVMNNIFDSAGSEEETVNLFDNVYGYQESWVVMTLNDYKKWGEEYEKWTNSGLNQEYFPQTVKYALIVVHRVIKTQFTHDFVSELFWVQDENHTHLGKDIDRIIYRR